MHELTLLHNEVETLAGYITRLVNLCADYPEPTDAERLVVGKLEAITTSPWKDKNDAGS